MNNHIGKTEHGGFVGTKILETAFLEVIICTTWVMLGNAGLPKLLESLEIGPGSWELGAGSWELGAGSLAYSSKTQ